MAKVILFKKVIENYGITLNEETNAKGWIKNISCPLPKHNDSKPSASINLEHLAFHCFACDIHTKSIENFVEAIEGCSYIQACEKVEFLLKGEISKPAQVLEKEEYIVKVKETFKVDYEFLKTLDCYLYNDTLKAKIKVNFKEFDEKSFNLNADNSKFISSKEASVGLVYPFNQWKQESTNKPWTFIMAGEKDMFLARAMGLNAITITGGENTLPEKFGHIFKDRKIAIVYDNDPTGIKGAKKLASFLVEKGAKQVKNITGHHKICENAGEDFFDFFFKYKKKLKDFGNIFLNTPNFMLQEKTLKGGEEKSINETIKNSGHHKWWIGDGILVSKHESTRIFNTYFRIYNHQETHYVDLRDGKQMEAGFYFTGSKNEVKKKWLSLKKGKDAKPSEWYVDILQTKTLQTMTFGSDIDVNKNFELTAFAFVEDYKRKEDLAIGAKYELLYKITNNPIPKKEDMVMLIAKIGRLKSIANDFELDTPRKQSLNKFYSLSKMNTTVKNKWDILFNNARYAIGLESDYEIFTVYEITFHSALKLPSDSIRKETHTRGVIYSFIIGESEIGKTKIGEQLTRVYGAGYKVNLQNATAKAVIGGSKQTATGFKTTLGVLPQNNEQLVILEESQRAEDNFRKAISESKSSGKVNIQRVAGPVQANCLVRQVEVANQIQDKSISSFAGGGIEIIKSLFQQGQKGNFQDVRRYDWFLIKDRKPVEPLDAFADEEDKKSMFSAEDYKNRLAWAWTRKKEDIIFSKETIAHLKIQSYNLQKKYDIRINLFGKGTLDKLKRFATAVAIALVSSDENFQKVYVLPGHIDFVIEFWESIYNNKIFKLGEYVALQKKYKTIEEKDFDIMKFVFEKSPQMIKSIYQFQEIKVQELQTQANIRKKEFYDNLNTLEGRYLIYKKDHGNFVCMGEKFKTLYEREHKLFVERYSEHVMNANKEIMVEGN